MKIFQSGILGILLFSALFSQEENFGKNKVQYKPFNWSYIQTNHFDIYFYEGGEQIANFTAVAAESAYASISKSFRYQLNNRVPLMVYNSHNDFQQTNIVGEYLEEGVGGVTELFKNRVVIPFEGNYRQYRHVIHHELVHAVINDMFYGGSIQSIISNNIRIQLPLWMNEGLAEYEALKWDVNSDMFMRDATIHTYLPPIEYLGGYFAYRGGQSVWYYIANKYGDQKIAEILHRVKGARNLDAGFKTAIGLSVTELSERWQKEQKVQYWPDIAKREDPADFATRLTNHVKENNFYNTSPAISPQGDKIAFISDRDDYFDVYVMSTIDNKIEKIVDGQRSRNFEELHLLTPGMSWSPDSKKIALTVKSGERDAIYLIDVNSGDEEKIEFDLDGIFSVDWSKKGDKLAFVGNTSYQSDIYSYDLNTKELTNLTNDVFSDSDPAFSADGKTVYFVSDRRNIVDPSMISKNFRISRFNYSQLDIYNIDISSKHVKRIVDYDNSDETNPVILSDGTKMLYVSDRSGIGNVYERNLTTGEDRPITNSITGVYQLSLSSDGNKLVFSSLNQAGFDLFLMKTPFEKKLSVTALEPTEYMKRDDLAAHKQSVDSTTTVSSTKSDTKNDTTGVYGDNVRVDFNNYVFTDEAGRIRDENFYSSGTDEKEISVNNNVDEDGNYIVNKYKLNFSPDIIYGNAAFSTFYGVQGTTMMAFSDMMGDHQIFFLTNLLLDLKNSDYVLAYYYLPSLIDWGIQGYHSARFLYLGMDLNRFRTYGINVSASLPIDRYYRIEGSLSWMNLLRENLDIVSDNSKELRELIIPSLSFVHDNTLWGYTAPTNGTRYNISAMFSPKLGSNALDFQTYSLDYRMYTKFWRNYSFVMRYSGGISVGKNAQRFFIGGTDGWINREFENGGIPIYDIADYAFLSPALPLRGYNYNVRNGTKFALVNYELRYPFIQYLVTGGLPISLGNITGATFIDVGSAWSDEDVWKGFGKNSAGKTVTQDLLFGTGFGVRMFFLGLPLKIDIAWAYEGEKFSIPKYYFSLGGDF